MNNMLSDEKVYFLWNDKIHQATVRDINYSVSRDCYYFMIDGKLERVEEIYRLLSEARHALEEQLLIPNIQPY